jgi:para-aminobenzoate synthetase component I
MRPLIQEVSTPCSPESLVEQLQGEPGIVLLRTALFDSSQARYSLVAARPFLSFRSIGSRCEIDLTAETAFRQRAEGHPPHGRLDSDRVLSPSVAAESFVHYGNPWRLLESLLSRYELLDEADRPFPLGGCFGYWGYDLKNFVEPKLARRAPNDLDLPDCQVGFYDSLVVFDHRIGKVWIVSTGLQPDGARSEHRACEQVDRWSDRLDQASKRTPAIHRWEDRPPLTPQLRFPFPGLEYPEYRQPGSSTVHSRCRVDDSENGLLSNLSRDEFLTCVERAQEYIRQGDIYQVNLSQRLLATCPFSGWDIFQRLSAASPAPFSAYLDCGGFQIASSSPELFLRLSGAHIQTRPIKGTRPRSPDPTRDAQLAFELQTSGKEMAELIMITDLLRNDLGKVCEFGSVEVPELVRLERFSQVQHLVSTVEGRLRPGESHFAALSACFPGGSITGAPKFRAMEIIDELEPVSRGPYTGALGYLGFNRESQLSIIIRAAVCAGNTAYFHVGAGIVADSVPAAEYEETLAKARGFCEALRLSNPSVRPCLPPTETGYFKYANPPPS